MKYRLLEPGEVIESGDEFYVDRWTVTECEGSKHREGDSPYRRPIPEPTWRKLSESAPVYPCWVSDGKEVRRAEKTWTTAQGQILPDSTEYKGSYESIDFDKAVTHWFPITLTPKPAPPVPEKSAEDEAFEKFNRESKTLFKINDRDILKETFKAGIEYARRTKCAS